jgi:outer membrane protein assembly factor BamB
MRSFEIFVAPRSSDAVRRSSSAPESERARRRPASEVLDVFIEGANVTARVDDAQASCVLRDLGIAVADLARRPRGKAIVRLYDEPWEMCIERIGATAALSVYRTGAEPQVAVYDRSVPFADVIESAREAIDALTARGGASPTVQIELDAAAAELRACPLLDDAYPMTPNEADLAPVVVEIDRDAPIAFGTDFAMRAGGASAGEPNVERADLHALLVCGRMRAEIRGRAIELGEGHPFILAERLLDVSHRALDAWERGVAYNVRGESTGVAVGVRLAPDGQLALTLGAASTPGAPASERALFTFPALSVADVLEASLAFGRALARAILRRDRSQASNLRLSAFRRSLRETSDALREACQKDAKINPTPEPYRAFAAALGTARSRGAPSETLPAARLRYAMRWRALVPGIDLRATFLCGDRLVVGAATETFCLERTSGQVIWRQPTQRATSVVTPGGIARLAPDGTLAVHGFGDGEVTLRTKLAPRAGGPCAGAVVHLPGLPRLLIVTEGERHLVAIDLTSGEPRWRFGWGKKGQGNGRGALRLKRAGKLLYFTSGDSALTALDVLTGAVVWRARDRLRFRTPPTLDHEALFAVAGGMSSLAHLHSIDPFSGRVVWTSALPSACTIEGSPLATGPALAVAVRDKSGLRICAVDRGTGEPLWTSRSVVAPVGTSWLAVDDLLVGNTPHGELVAIEAATGEIRWRHVLGPRTLEADLPRRLEPVLRSGALFVPHSDVHVFRPRDGALLATIAPLEAIPDMLRVDEKCDVYVAEESGHLVSFGALPRLSVVR